MGGPHEPSVYHQPDEIQRSQSTQSAFNAERARTRAKVVPDPKVGKRVCTEGECDDEATACDAVTRGDGGLRSSRAKASGGASLAAIGRVIRASRRGLCAECLSGLLPGNRQQDRTALYRCRVVHQGHS